MGRRLTRHRGLLSLAAALVLVTLNLRIPLAAVPPVLGDIRDGLGLSGGVAGLLTTLPVLCFGLAAPLAALLTRRRAQEVLLLWCLAAILAGEALRTPGTLATVFAGTLLLGVGIAVANVLMPSIVKRHFPDPGPMMGAYTASLSIPVVIAGGLTVPIADALGGWGWGIGVWTLAAAAGVAVWVRYARALPAGTVEEPRAVRLRADRTAWLVTGTFALQSFLFYAFLTWVPEILRDAGISRGGAGAYLSLATLVAIPASLLTPVVAARGQRGLVVASWATWILGLAGLLWDPATATWVWMALLSVGQGIGIALALMLVVLRSPDAAHAAALSAMAQGVGYTFAAVGPFALGALHDATGSWTVPLLVMVAAAFGLLVCGLGAAR